jgi:hypothetical protein
LWFKKGDVDQMVAEARARVEAARAKGVAPSAELAAVAEGEAPADDVRPLEDRYVDDGSVSAEDRKKFSLRSGGTATALPTVGHMPGERLSESEMIGEIGKGKRTKIIVAAVVVLIALGTVLYVGMRNKGAAKSSLAVPAPAVAEPVAPPPAEPPPPAPPAPAPAAAKPAAASEEAAAKPKAVPKKSSKPAKVAAKKAKSKKRH